MTTTKQATLKATPVFEKNWAAIHALTETGERKYKYIINTGSSRSSKTFSLIDCYDLYARSQYNKRLTVWRDTKIDCKATVGEDIAKHLKNTNRWRVGFKFMETTSEMNYLATGSEIQLHGTDDHLKVHGLTQDAAWLNEPYKISREVFDQIDQRTSDFIFIDWNPLRGHWIDDLQKDPRAIVIHSTFTDNPFCPDEQRRKILSYQPVSMCAIVLKKKLTEEEANVYDCAKNILNIKQWAIDELVRCKENEFKRSANKFNWEVYGLGLKSEKPHRIFHFEECSREVYNKCPGKIYTGVDWGVVDPFAILDAKYYDGALYLDQRNYASENEIRATATTTELLQMSGMNGEGEDGKQQGLVKWLFGKLQIPYNREIVCDPNRQMKILGLRDAGWEYAIAARKPPGSIEDGIGLVNQLRVYYTPESLDLKYEQENYSRALDKQGKVLEEPEDINNHLMDDVRYIATHLEGEGIITII